MKNKKIGKKQVFIISVHPYEQECLVVVNGSLRDAYNFLKKQKSRNAQKNIAFIEKEKWDLDETMNNGEGYLYTKLPHGYVMMFNHEDSWISTVGILVHEATHLAQYILRDVRVELSLESEEAYTYLTTKIVTDILKEIY